MNPKNADRIFQRVKTKMRRWYGGEYIEKRCLYWMQTGMAVLNGLGIKCSPAAGSAYWKLQEDDGKMSHFGFEWMGADGEARRKAVLPDASTSLPETHCWIWLPTGREVVDFSTGYVPEMAKELGFEFKSSPPPKYIWAKPESLWPRFIYKPNKDATRLAITAVVASRKGTR